MLTLDVRNLGEIAIDQTAEIQTTVDGNEWYGYCTYNDVSVHCTRPDPGHMEWGPFSFPGTLSVRVQLQGGQQQFLQVPAGLAIPSYVHDANATVDADPTAPLYMKSATVGDVISSFPAPVSVCF